MVLMACAVAGPIHAATVAHDVAVVLDRVGPGQPFKPGDVRRARIFYDEGALNQRTKRIRLLQMQQLDPLAPVHLNAAEMPMDNSFIDLNGPRIRFHYAAAPAEGPGPPCVVVFDENTERMTLRDLSSGQVLLAGKYTVDPRRITGPEIEDAVTPLPLVGIDLDETVTAVAGPPGPANPFKVGTHDRVRLVYDPAKLDPRTGMVRLYGFHHFIMGKYQNSMPVDQATLDMSARPYRLSFSAVVDHGRLIHVTFRPDGSGQVADAETGAPLLSGVYTIDPTPIPMDARTDPEALPAPAGPERPAMSGAVMEERTP